MEKKEYKNIHSGHRGRMKERALKFGFDTFEKHEMLEMLLYSTIPQKDTNPIAHDLINSFGSFHAVFEASYDELLKVKGMTKTAAFLIKMSPSLFSFYLRDKNNNKNAIISSSEAAFNYLMPFYIGKTVEVASVLFLNNAGRLLAFEQLNHGTVNTAEIHVRTIIELCIKYNATQVILCHNHPSGVALPSGEDFMTTKNLNAALTAINSKLLDHLIVSNNDYISMSQSMQFKKAFVCL